MSDAIVHAAAGATLLGGGAVRAADVHHALTIAPVLVAADGGGDAALALGLVPEAVIGDLDSLSPAARKRLGARVHHIPEQESTDFGKCLRLVRAPYLLALGFTGLRLDHTLAALTDLIRAPNPVVILAEEEVICRLPPRIALDLTSGTRVSLFPFGAMRGRSTGLRWPIDGLEFAPGQRAGTSNEAMGRVEIETEGPGLLLLPRTELGHLLVGLGLSDAV